METLEVNFIRASLRLELDECPLVTVSKGFPELEYSIQDKQILTKGGVLASIIVKQSDETDPFFRSLNGCSSVKSLNFLYFGKEECKVRIDFGCTSCIFMRLMEDLRVSPDSIKYKNGSMEATFSLKDHEEFRNLLKYLKDSGVRFSVQEVTRHNVNDKLLANGLNSCPTTLTAKQLEVLRHAYLAGYFDRDKKVNLGEIAEHFGVSPATASVHLRAGLKKILKSYVGI